MTEKLSFTVENVEVVKENPDSNFALLALDFFASGDNLHDMYVSEDTLMRTADTIKNCPLVWKYDPTLDDIYTHDPEEVPCGFVPESSTITNKKLEDGRTMLSVVAYVWKRYTGELLKFFKRDGGKKPVSVEMNVYNTKTRPDGKIELMDYRYEGITILGSFVTPAIPSAMATVLSFSQIKEEYDKDFEKEFPDADIIIPYGIRENAEKGLELIKKNKKGGTSAGLAFAHYLTQNKTIPHEKIKEIANYFSTHKYTSTNETDWLLWGGNDSRDWAEKMLERELITFPYKSREDMNPALKGIDPPVSVAQATEIARQAESIGSDQKKNGWAIAISSFKKTHYVKDGKWVKKEGSTVKASEDASETVSHSENTNKEMAMDNENKEIQEMAEDTATPVETFAPPVEEEKEEPKEEKKEEKGIEKKFEFPVESMAKFFAEEEEEEEEDEEVKMAKAEIAKGEEADFGLIMNGIYKKMCKMQEYAKKQEEEKKAYMAEIEELKKFKYGIEETQKSFAVENALKEIEEKVVFPEGAREEMIEESKKYSLDNLDEWKTYCKAKSFDFAVKEASKSDVIKVGLPFGNTTSKKDDLWAS